MVSFWFVLKYACSKPLATTKSKRFTCDLRSCLYLLSCVSAGYHSKKSRLPASQTGHLPDERPFRDGHLRRQSPRFAQARQPLLSTLASLGLGFEIPRP